MAGVAAKILSSAGNRYSKEARSRELNGASTLNVLSGIKRNEKTNQRRTCWINALISLLLISLLFSGWLWAMVRLWDGILKR
jgi:hypothetical protein